MYNYYTLGKSGKERSTGREKEKEKERERERREREREWKRI